MKTKTNIASKQYFYRLLVSGFVIQCLSRFFSLFKIILLEVGIVFSPCFLSSDAAKGASEKNRNIHVNHGHPVLVKIDKYVRVTEILVLMNKCFKSQAWHLALTPRVRSQNQCDLCTMPFNIRRLFMHTILLYRSDSEGKGMQP